MRASHVVIVLAWLAAAGKGTAQRAGCPLIIIDGVVQPPPQGPGEAFGVSAYQCASCAFKRDMNQVPQYSFSAEPIVLEVTPWSSLRAGDVIVAINSQPIATRAGADQFTFPPEGLSELTVRREGGLVRLRLAPRRECTSLTHMDPNAIDRIEVVRGEAARAYGAPAVGGVVHIFLKQRAPQPRVLRPMPNAGITDSGKGGAAEGRFGFAISCLPSCTRARASDGTDYWKFDGHPAIAGIRAGGPAAMAGLQVGDIVTEIDGISILTEEGALRFQRAERKESLNLTVVRNGKQAGYLLKAR